MLLDSNILIYGAEGGEPQLDAILDRTDLAVASVTCIETLGFHRLGEAAACLQNPDSGMRRAAVAGRLAGCCLVLVAGWAIRNR